MGKSYRGNAKYDRWRKRDSKPRRGKRPYIPFDDHDSNLTEPVEMEKEADKFLQEGLDSVH
jgi:hypothetical protein